ncbi:MAG: HprK-related kinase A [Pseudomonadota bacterium]
MQVHSLSEKQIARLASGAGLAIRCGPMITRLKTIIPELLHDVAAIYGQYEVADLAVDGANICVDMRYTSFLRRYVRRQITGASDRPGPFAPLPPDISFVGFEMAQNWHIANTYNHCLLFHAASVASPDGQAIIMPGMSGSGKSTLGIAMGYRGWRFLGDEFALYDPREAVFQALARPASLKNQSIEALNGWAPEAAFSRPFEKTPKGRMAYLNPPRDALAPGHPPARFAMAVFPRFVADEEPRIGRMREAEALMEFTNACINFERLSDTAFETVARWAATIPAYRMTYPSLEKACEIIQALEKDQREVKNAD